jgi:hypothetical protein
VKNNFFFKSKTQFISVTIIFLYVIYILINPNFFDKNYFFIQGDFLFYFDLKKFLSEGISGYYPNANGGEGGYDQIRYVIDILIRALAYFLNEYLFFPLWLINRLLIIIPSFFLIYSLYDYTHSKIDNFIPSLIASIFISGSIFVLQNVNLYIWVSIIGVVYFFKFLEDDLKKEKYNNIFFVGLFTVLFFSQLRTVIFLTYIMFFYFSYLIFYKKHKFLYLFKYVTILAFLTILFNLLTFINYFETRETFLVTTENINLKQTRISHIMSYNLGNINPLSIFRFLLNTNNATNNLLGSYVFLYYLSFISIFVFFLGIFRTNVKNSKHIILGYIFLFATSFYGTIVIKYPLLNLPGLWTISSPYHIIAVGLPFISLSFANGLNNLFNISKKFKIIIIIISCLSLFTLNASLNFNYYVKKYLEINHSEFYQYIPTIFTKNFIEVNNDYFEIKNKIDINKKIFHLPILEGHYLIQGSRDTLRFPLLFALFHELKIVFKSSYVFQNSKNKDLFFEGVFYHNEKKLLEAFEKEHIKYILINKNIYHNKKELDNFYPLSINFLKLKPLIKNKNFNLYEIIK